MSLSTLVILWYKPKMPCATVPHYRMKRFMEGICWFIKAFNVCYAFFDDSQEKLTLNGQKYSQTPAYRDER